MKKLLIASLFLTGCNTNQVWRTETTFDWMPNDLLWQHNIRDCRSQPQCNAADLFDRT